MKYYVYTTNPDGFIEGWSNSFILSESVHKTDGWVLLGEVDFDKNAVDMNAVRAAAVEGIDHEIARKTEDFTAGMEQLKARKAELLALPAGESDE